MLNSMPAHEPTTLATVTFEGDLRLTVLQALSIDRLFDLAGLARYVVVLNGQDNDALRAELLRHLEGRVSDRFISLLDIITPADMPRGGDGSGWYGQQVIKLALAEIIDAGSYLMLDGKNHFIRPATIGDFYHDGLPATVVTPTSPTWEKYVRASLEAMDAFSEERLARMMPTTTPYLMHTKDVLRTVERLEAKYSAPLAGAIRQTGGATEFFLYYAHLVSTYAEIPYVNRPSLTRTLFNDWPQDPNKVLEIIADAAAKDVPMFGLHRRRLPQLSADQKAAIKELWGRHLLKDWEDADWFMAC